MPKKSKTLCVDDLRHAEYYGMQSTFDELYQKSQNGEVFENLMDLILSRDNILLAYRNIKANKGSYTAGTDKKNITDIGSLNPDDVIKRVRFIVTGSKHGYCTKYAHMDTLNVSAGQTVTHGTTIGTTGNTGSSTGSHLHIECLYNGEYYNPLFYFDVGEGTLYGETPGGGGSPGNVIPPDSYDDATVQALMEEAARYLGYPYVWGGSSPSTSFDCSGFVCWVFTNSGVHNLPRTMAQGIYDQCTPVSAADAKAGDIIFFTGTYNSPGPVSHVGIYCGNGVMIHCGDPIKYASINTPYWQSHFYSFGRLN